MAIQRVLTLTPTSNSAGEPFLQAQLLLADQGELFDEVGDIRLPQDKDVLSADMTVAQFLREFHAGKADCLQETAKAYGRKLYQSMFATDSALGKEWGRACNLAQKDGLRLEIRIDQRDADGEPVRWGCWPLAMIPFELLHDGKGFLFRRLHWRSVRTLRNQPVRAPRTRVRADVAGNAPARVLLGCANVRELDGTARLPQDDFQAHANAVAQLGHNGKAHCLPPLMCATRTQLAERLQTDQPEVLIWVGHGVAQGSALIVHDEKSQYYPEDSGTPMQASDFANLARAGAVDLAFLWSCHGAGTHQPLDLGVAEALLDPDQGDVMAVVASYSALPSAAIAAFAGQVLQAWALDPAGDLEQGLARARAGLPEQSLLWARPVLLSRAKRAQAVFQLPRPIVEAVPPDSTVSANLRWLPPLPDPSPHFLGRDDFFKLAENDLQTHAVLVLEGLPGVGKTEMALALAHQWRGQGKDVAFVEVTAFASAGDLVPRMGQWRGLDKVENDEQLFAAYRGVPLLLVVDNAEDILGAETAGRLLALLTGLHAASPSGFRCLITSRRSLAGEGETMPSWISTLEVPQLPPADARALFISSAGPRLALQQHALVDDLMVELDGIARAIVLMASQLRHDVDVPELQRRIREMGVAAISAEEVFGEEISPKFDRKFAKERLLSSLNLALVAAEKECPQALWLFDLMGAFPGGLAQDWLPFEEHSWLQPALTVLLQHHLVSLRGDERRLSQAAPISSLARLKLARRISSNHNTDELKPILTYLHAHLATITLRMRESFGRSEISSALRSFSKEEANLLQAMTYLDQTSTETHIDIVADIAYCMTQIYLYVDRPKETLIKLQPTFQLLTTNWPKHRVAAIAYHAIADLTLRTNDLINAEQAYKMAAQIYSENQALLGEANTTLGLGRVKSSQADVETAEHYCNSALQLFNKIQEPQGQANTLMLLGDLKRFNGDHIGAEEKYHAGLLIYENINSLLGQANTRHVLGIVKKAQGDSASARKYYVTSFAIFDKIGDRLGKANILQCLGDLETPYDGNAALENYNQAIKLYEEIDTPHGLAMTLLGMGDLKIRQGDVTNARLAYASAQQLFINSGNSLGQADALYALGKLWQGERDFHATQTALSTATQIYSTIGNNPRLAATLFAAGEAYRAEGRLNFAFIKIYSSLLLYQENKNWILVGVCHGHLSEIALQTNSLSQAVALGGRALQIMLIQNNLAGQLTAYTVLIRIFLEQGNPQFLTATYLAWQTAQAINDPIADTLGESFTKLLREMPNPNGVDFSQAIADNAQPMLFNFLSDIEAQVAAGEIDPYAPILEDYDGN